MPTQVVGPVLLQAVGDTYTPGARITSIVWTGVTAAGNEAEVRDPITNSVLWLATTPDTVTYLGINFGFKGLNAPHGFKLTQTVAGTSVLVYIMEL